MACFLLLSLTGCNFVRLAYHQLDWLIPYHLETYMDFSHAQSAYLERRVSSALTWHCQSQLPRYVVLLRTASREFQSGSFDRSVLTEHSRQIREFWLEMLAHAEPVIYGILIVATDEQVEKMLEVFDEDNREWIEEFETITDQEIRDTYVEVMSDELERWFGTLEKNQKKMVARWSRSFQPLGMLGFDMRRRWQQQLGAIMRRRGDPQAFQAEMNALLLGPDADRPTELVDRLENNHEITLDLIWRIGLSSTPKQREHLQRFSEKLAGDLEEIDCTF